MGKLERFESNTVTAHSPTRIGLMIRAVEIDHHPKSIAERVSASM